MASPSSGAGAAQKDHLPLDPAIWRACAGTAVRIPAVNSKVYYFPQGHAEQAWSVPDFSGVRCTVPYYICEVTSVGYFADLSTDAVFLSIELSPISGSSDGTKDSSKRGSVVEDDAVVADAVFHYAKVLTPSDANNGGGFSVPRYCADSIFPPLNYNDDPPVQRLSIRDVQGKVWEFRHIYRGTPRRHLLTTGWSKFVNAKKLVAGDSAVFIKNEATGELFVGIRRPFKATRGVDHQRYAAYGEPQPVPDVKPGEGFSRAFVSKIPPASVIEAVRSAELGRSFHVTRYATAGEFVVEAEDVEKALRFNWIHGTRIQTAAGMDQSGASLWHMGTLNTVVANNCKWPSSPWRMLQVDWDKPTPELAKYMNPWQVEVVAEMPQNLNLLADEECATLSTGSGPSIPIMKSPSPVLLSLYPCHAGMQGTRQNQIFDLSLRTSGHNYNQLDHMENPLRVNNLQLGVSYRSNGLTFASPSPPELLSPPSQRNVSSRGKENIAQWTSGLAENPHLIDGFTKKANTYTLKLFGQIIQVEKPEHSDPMKTDGDPHPQQTT